MHVGLEQVHTLGNHMYSPHMENVESPSLSIRSSKSAGYTVNIWKTIDCTYFLGGIKMGKTLKKCLICVLSIMLLGALLAGCGSKSPADLIIGQWLIPGEEDHAESTIELVELEFFSDGTYTSNTANYAGTYSIDEDRIKLNGILVEPLTYTFEVDEDSLTFYEDGEVVDEYKKVE